MVEQTVSTFGRLDAAFNNAGVPLVVTAQGFHFLLSTEEVPARPAAGAPDENGVQKPQREADEAVPRAPD